MRALLKFLFSSILGNAILIAVASLTIGYFVVRNFSHNQGIFDDSTIRQTSQEDEADRTPTRVERPMSRFLIPEQLTEQDDPTPQHKEEDVIPKEIREQLVGSPTAITLFSHKKEEDPDLLSPIYAPYGRLIPCQTVITLDSSNIETPIIGLVTKNLVHDGKIIIPAGAEVHGTAKTDRSRERIAAEGSWVIVWRTRDELIGTELVLNGIALNRELNDVRGEFGLNDGSAGIKGQLIKTTKFEEIKLFAAAFISGAAEGLLDTERVFNPFTGQSDLQPQESLENAALLGIQTVIDEYANRIRQSIDRDGFFVRVPAGKQFYLYVSQTIDRESGKRGNLLSINEQ